MWSILHDIVIALVLGLNLLYRVLFGKRDDATREYAAYRAGRRIHELRGERNKPLIWFHGVSVGEVTALDGVITAVRAQTQGNVAIAVSTMTRDGLLAARRLSSQPDIAFIYPLDLSFLARRVVRSLNPRALVIVDGDFWFQMIRACERASVPVMVINGRLSESSVKGHERLPAYSRQLFAGIVLASVQSETMAERFAHFIPPSRIVVDGNVKLDLPQTGDSDESRLAIRRRLGIEQSNFCFVFGSIHPAELEEVAKATNQLLTGRSNVHVIIAPRHPDKFSRGVLDQYFPGIRTAWVVDDGAVSEPASLIWVNRLGVLRDLYQIANAAFVGGTFCDVGGHNLSEPALAGVPVLYGPDVHAQLPLHELLETYGASKQVGTGDGLYSAMAAIVDNPSLGEKMATNARRLRSDSEGLTARVAARILEIAELQGRAAS